MSEYKRNHYVPIWYQDRFIPQSLTERRFYYLDLHPDICVSNGHKFQRESLLHWGPKKCFFEDDLYTTRFGSWESTEIEEKFFGKIDSDGQKAVEYFSTFSHPGADGDMFNAFLRYMVTQKLRTPKGLGYLANLARSESKNTILFALQGFQKLYFAIWAECVWSIADASNSDVKFLVTDHPVSVYNQACFPGSKYCMGFSEPDIWLSGTHTLFPLSQDKILILTNLSWVRNPYGDPKYFRPNPNLLRDSFFNFLQIQTGRQLSAQEVCEINFIIKSRARRYIASTDKDSLFPERHLRSTQWDCFGKSLLLMPDPRSLTFTSNCVLGYSDNSAAHFDEYGRRPRQQGYSDKKLHDREWISFNRFQAEFAKNFGPIRRGVSFELGKTDPSRDSDEMHKHYLEIARKFKDSRK